MPFVTGQLWSDRMLDQKSAFIGAITDALVEHAGARPDGLHVILQEGDPENCGRAGILGVDRANTAAAVPQPSPRPTSHVALRVRDLGAARGFYCDVPGFGVREEGEFLDRSALVSTTAGCGFIAVRADGAVDHVALEVDDLAALKARAREHGVRIIRGRSRASTTGRCTSKTRTGRRSR